MQEDRDGWTPLHYAISNKQVGIIKTLVESGADVHAVDKDGKTPLLLAKEMGYGEAAFLDSKKSACSESF